MKGKLLAKWMVGSFVKQESGIRHWVVMLCAAASHPNGRGEVNELLQPSSTAMRCTVTVAVPISLDFNQNGMRMWLFSRASATEKAIQNCQPLLELSFLLAEVSGIVILVHFISKC